MNTLEFIVWQFVRIMVHLEEHGSGGRGSLYEAWRKVWEKLDKRLTDLAESDAEAYASLMMSEKVVIDCQSPAHLKDAILAAESVVKSLRAAIRGEPEQDHRRDLEFEAEGMAALAKGFKSILQATSGGSPGGRQGWKSKARAKGRGGRAGAGGSGTSR